MEKEQYKIKVSIIVPVYNIEKYIERCLLSLVNQTLKEIEIICIDDGSTDNSVQVVEEVQAQYPDKIKLIKIKNSGVSVARNSGLEVAKGEYIGFVDGDDYVRRDMYERLYAKAIDEQSDIVSSAYVNLFERRSRVIHSGDMQYYGKSVYESPRLLTCDVSFLWNKIFKKSMIEEYNLRFEVFRVFEDMLFVDSSFLVANRISKVDEPFYYYRRVRLGSATNTFSRNLFDLFPALERLYDFYKKHNAYEHFNDNLLFITLNHIFIRYKTVVPNDEITIGLKLEFLEESFAFLDKHFPEWKSNDYYFSIRNGIKELYIDKEYWTEYINYVAVSGLPEELKEKAAEIKARGVAPKTDSGDLTKKNPVNKTDNKNLLSELELGVLYKKYRKKNRINKKSILLDSQHGENLNGNMFYFLKHLLTNPKYSDFTVYVTYSSEKENAFLEKLNYYALKPQLVELHSKQYVKVLATAKYLFNDTSFPVFFYKREGQMYLNTWHGTALKTLGVSSKGEVHRIGNLQRNFCNADYVLCPNEHMKNVFSNDYFVNTLSRNTRYMFAGYPRNSVFFEPVNQRIADENNLTGKQVIAYMPTWRGSVEKVEADDLNHYLHSIDSALTDNQIMFVNLHPYMDNLIDYSQFNHIKPVPVKYEIYDFLNCCDVLITDYSSVFFDFAVTGKKIILFTYDRDEYLSGRGMYFSLSDFPFPSVETVEELIKEINSDETEDISSFVDEFCAYDSADTVQDILDYILFEKEFRTDCYIDERPDKKDENVLVFGGNLYNNLHPDNLYKSICKADKNSNYIITFLTRFLRANYSVLNAFTDDVKSYSVLGRLLYLKPSSRKKLGDALKDYRYFNKHQAKFLSYVQDEYDRLYGHMDIDRIICFGGKSATFLAILSCAECEKILLIPTTKTFNKNLNQNIYGRFDKIYYKQAVLGKKLNVKGNNIEKISDYKDVFRK